MQRNIRAYLTNVKEKKQTKEKGSQLNAFEVGASGLHLIEYDVQYVTPFYS